MAQHPDLDVPVAGISPTQPSTESTHPAPSREPNRKVLFADASEVSRAVAILQLKHLGFLVDGVSDLVTLKHALSTTRYGVVLIADSIGLPSKLELSDNPPRVLYLVHSTPRSDQTPTWVDGILLKPLTLRILSQALSSSLDSNNRNKDL